MRFLPPIQTSKKRLQALRQMFRVIEASPGGVVQINNHEVIRKIILTSSFIFINDPLRPTQKHYTEEDAKLFLISDESTR